MHDVSPLCAVEDNIQGAYGALKSLLSAVQLQGESAVTAPPFFPSTGRGTTRFWGTEQGPTVFLWEGLGEEGREECEQ
jgi:hypothetical protein